jgi:hypothetical protein
LGTSRRKTSWETASVNWTKKVNVAWPAVQRPLPDGIEKPEGCDVPSQVSMAAPAPTAPNTAPCVTDPPNPE